jgi:aryl-phospho-beta-D-glucosidase BglC (GH1 family)
VARFQLTNYTATDDTDAQNFTRYRNWLNGELAKLDQFIPQAHANHMYVVIDLHAPPGGGSTTGMRLFTQTNYQDELVHTWQTIATKYVNEPTVWGYDLVNEPVVGFAPTNIDGWNELATRVGLAIRAIDTTHAIIVEPEFGSDSSGFDYLTPLAGVSGVVYSPHVYNPMTYTHQGINGYPAWPATQNVPTQADLTTYTQSARNFQLDYNVNMYVGEFSVIRSAQGAQSPATYLDNAVTLFDSYGWDWTYHAFRESQYWDLEYPNGTATTPHPTVTDRLQVIKSRFSNNQIPF